MAAASQSLPGLADAQRAAAVLADAGAGCVLLHGSVSRDQQTPGSDIDLVAIFDDLGDYSTRRSTAAELRQKAERVSGRRANVFVTDRPEWCHRTTRMLTTFERVFADGAVTLLDRPPVSVDWNKAIGLADMDMAEAVNTLNHAINSLDVVELLYTGTGREKQLRSSGDPADLHEATEGRLWKLCGQAHDAVEHGLKSIIHATSTTPSEDLYRGWDYKTHQLHDLVKLVEPRYRDAAAELLRPITLPTQNIIVDYHMLSNYPSEAEEWQHPTEEIASNLARCAQRIVDLATGIIEQATSEQGIPMRPDWARRLAQARLCTNRIGLAMASEPF
ncbi:nucleotidyltransferase domain-containing protein [Candidatus Poriferisocius sp.]|uniref:nucleotidyltransferase domain-containing protein n=1 Tax=Candidatus Poriferisocius sp. TaxID=3101276 RepID=UPI003B0196FA